MLQVGPGPDLREPQPGELLLRIRATSVNPIDCRRRTGYGHKLLGLINASQFPLILGHDLAAEVEQAPENPAVKPHGFKKGDKVFGALPPGRNGTYASHCLALPEWVRPIPEGLSFEQAAALPYVALTSFAALKDLRLSEKRATGKRVLVQAGVGGIGSFCIQLLSAWGAQVTALASEKNLEYCRELGATEARDYHNLKEGDLVGYDAVLAAFGLEDTVHFHPRLLAQGGSYTTLTHPLLEWSDRFGVLPGGMSAGSVYLTRRLTWGRRGRRYRWSLFSVNNKGMTDLVKALENKQVQPVIEQVLPLEEVAKAHELVEAGHVRGKLVLNLP